MPIAMRKGTTRRAIPGELDEEFVQHVFVSWLNEVGEANKQGERDCVIERVEKLCKVDLTPLTRQSEGYYSVSDYQAACNGECDPVEAKEAVKRANEAWQKPLELLGALEVFERCLQTPRVDRALEGSDHSRQDHLEVVHELMALVKKAMTRKATEVCLESDAFVL